MAKKSSVKGVGHKLFIISLILAAIIAVGYSPVISGQVVLQDDIILTNSPQDVVFTQYRHMDIKDSNHVYSIVAHRITRGRDAVSFQINDGKNFYYVTVRNDAADYRTRSVILENTREIVFELKDISNRKATVSLYRK